MASILSGVVRLVLDTNVVVAALRSGGGASREVLRRCLQGRYRPLLGNALWLEYADVLGRGTTLPGLTAEEAEEVIGALAASAEWVPTFYLWRPNLPDEADNHLIELALAGAAQAIVTHNVRDVAHGELKRQGLRVVSPGQCLEIWP